MSEKAADDPLFPLPPPLAMVSFIVILGCLVGGVYGCIRDEERGWMVGTVDDELFVCIGDRIQPAVSLKGKRLNSDILFSGMDGGGRAVFTRTWYRNSAIQIHPVGSTIVLSLPRAKLTYTVREVSDSSAQLVRVGRRR